jgi:hypothetical protein
MLSMWSKPRSYKQEVLLDVDYWENDRPNLSWEGAKKKNWSLIPDGGLRKDCPTAQQL